MNRIILSNESKNGPKRVETAPGDSRLSGNSTLQSSKHLSKHTCLGYERIRVVGKGF